MAIQFFNPGKRLIGVLIGVTLFSVLAFLMLIINWPQGNPYTSIKVEIPKGSTVTDVSNILREKNIISNERVFKIAVRTLGYERNLPAGSYSLKEAQTNLEIIHQLVYGVPNFKRLTIYEGWTVDQIADELERVLDIDGDDFRDLSVDRSLLKKWNIVHNSFEGFLFPDTYFFMKNEDPQLILEMMVQEYRKCMSDSLIDRAHQIGMNEKEVITLASIIEGEALYDVERPIISGVYHNRLNKNMKLQADPTIQFIIDDGPRRLLNKDLKIKSPYNTYLHKGLPPGPINNPGKESILAALFPMDNDYLFFVARGDGYHTFTRTEKEHNRAKKKFQKVRKYARKNIN